MRVETVVVLRVDEEDALRLNARIASAMPGVAFGAGTFQVRFRHAPEAVRTLLEALDELGLSRTVQEERSFSMDEIDRSPALRLGGGAPILAARRAPAATGPSCAHAPAETDSQGDLVLLEDGASPSWARTRGGDLLVGEEVAAALIREHVSGCLLKPARDAAGGISPFFELVALNRLPPMHAPPTKIVQTPEDACPECGRGGLRLRSSPFYDVEVEQLLDFNVTYETFGAGEDMARDVLVSQRLFRMLREQGVPDLAVEPVLFV